VSRNKCKKLIIATRASELALWQSEYIKFLIENKFPKVSCDFLKVITRGDRTSDRISIQTEGKSLFTKELENSMLNGDADIAVHSLKDVPYKLPDGFILAAFTPRGDPHDAFVSNDYESLDDLPKGSIVGTSSLRRKIQILNYREDLIVKNLMGNVSTRLQKLDSKKYDAIILAAAGLFRLNLNARVKSLLPLSISLPAIGQGIIAVECLSKDKFLVEKLSKISDKESIICATAERSFSELIQANCREPIAAYATFKEEILILQVMVANSDGTILLKMNSRKLENETAKVFGYRVAKNMIDNGAREMLNREVLGD
jgi:hydroxymethylbilane synthase